MSIILLVILVTYQTVVAVTDMIDIKKNKGTEITEKIRLDFIERQLFGDGFRCASFFYF